MILLNRYIRNSVIHATALVVLGVLGVETFMEFVGQLTEIGVAHYSLGKAFLYVGSKLPSDLYQLFPMAGFLGCLMGLGRLASGSELIVMRAAGVSIGAITFSVIKAALIMIFITTLCGELIAPVMQAKGEDIRSKALSHALGFKALGGLWLRDGTSFIHIDSIESNVRVNGVTRFVMDAGHKLLSAQYARHAIRIKDHWDLMDVRESRFKGDQIVQTTSKSLPLRVNFDPGLLQLRRKNVDHQSLFGLYRAIPEDRKSALAAQYIFAFCQRLLQPLTTVIMICLGVPFIFGSLRTASTGIRIMTGIIIGFVFYMLNQFVWPFAMVYQIPPVVAAVMPSVLFMAVCVILLRRSWH